MEKLKKLNQIENEIQKEKENNRCLTLKSNNQMLLSIFIKGQEKNRKLQILEHSKQNLLNGGEYSEKRNCYYPSGKSNKEVAEYNKLEKLFKKWGFKSL